MARGRPRKGTKKRKATDSVEETTAVEAQTVEEVKEFSEPVEDKVSKASNRGKRAKTIAEQKPEPEYFPEQRNLEDLWRAAFPVGTEWDNMDKLREINWNFKTLEDAFEEGGELYGETVYMFGSTEPQLLTFKGEQKVILIPVVVVVFYNGLLVGGFSYPPSDKIGVKSVQRETEDIIPMKAMKMAWIPYIPLGARQSQVDRLKTKIFTLGCTQRRSALKLLKEERVRQYDYCLPYLQPLQPDEDEEDTVVDIMYPLEPPIVTQFDYELDELEEFTDNLIKDEVLAEDQKEEFQKFVKEQVRERKKAQKEKREARRTAIEDMDAATRSALENMKVYKFYPIQTPDTPDVSNVKVPFINRYYGKAHRVF